MKNIRLLFVAVVLSATVVWAQQNNTAKVNVPATQNSFSGVEHPEMDAAIESLKDARKHLDDAKRDFDGHRAKAVKLVDDAIAEVRLGIASDK